MGKQNKTYINCFSPKHSRLSSDTDRKELSLFDAGSGFEYFSGYLLNDAMSNSLKGEGVTHLIWDYARTPRKLIAYYTLSVSAIPYDDGLGDDADTGGLPYISAFEIKMFAVDKEYQDVFYKNGEFDLPISAWCLMYIIEQARYLSQNVISAKALYLHSVKTAETFYVKNGFQPLEHAMRPLYSVDSDLKAMWMAMYETPLTTI